MQTVNFLTVRVRTVLRTSSTYRSSRGFGLSLVRRGRRWRRVRDTTDTIGGRVRRARRGEGLTQMELARRLQRSESWVRGVEAGRITLDRHSAIDRLVNVLDVDMAWLLGQPYQPASPDQDAGQGAVRKLRSALRRTSLILSGHPRIS